MSLDGARWINEFNAKLVDTGRKVKGWPSYRRRTLYEYTAHPEHPATLYGNNRDQRSWCNRPAGTISRSDEVQSTGSRKQNVIEAWLERARLRSSMSKATHV